MYNIIQLNDKNLSELQVIAKELGIKKADSYKKEDLVYKILDEQAIVGATKKVAADKLKEERSKKPAVVREKIVELVGDLPRIELFAREKTKGWDVWGNEVESDIELENYRMGVEN